ncbi:MAG: HPr family phosphocarrier protein [Lachnospiraceae bacterium]|nr:HPr family phosphocarrier protein [Lachnospiraceae bacterium]MDD3794781.1 HPr family phosphocarrier protein [Lachnospiraceae bacterium]
MKSFSYVITDEVGIHARPAGILAKEAKTVDSKITLSANGKTAEATKLMAIMSMGVKKGMEVTVTAEGGDEDASIAKMEEFFKANL